MTDKTPRECPRCHDETAVAHCAEESPCEWLTCRKCKGTTDPTQGTGFDTRGPFTLEQ